MACLRTIAIEQLEHQWLIIADGMSKGARILLIGNTELVHKRQQLNERMIFSNHIEFPLMYLKSILSYINRLGDIFLRTPRLSNQ